MFINVRETWAKEKDFEIIKGEPYVFGRFCEAVLRSLGDLKQKKIIPVNYKWKIGQIFVAFSKHLNFTIKFKVTLIQSVFTKIKIIITFYLKYAM
jgi:hypothetical protein